MSPTSRALVAPLVVIAGLALGQGAVHAIGPGQEPLLADMLGKGVALPGPCTWAGATVEETRVVSWYTCGEARIELELRHPTEGAGSVAQTQRFAIRGRANAPLPPGLVDALAGRLRAREAEFTWTSTDAATPVALPRATEPQGQFLGWLGGALALIALAAGAAWWLARRLARSRGREPTPRRGTPAGDVAALLLSLGFAAAIRGTTSAFGSATVAGLSRGPALVLVAAIGFMLGYAMLALVAAAVLARLPTRLPRVARLLIGPALYLAVAYPTSLTHQLAPPFGDVVAGRANHVEVEQRRDRPAVTYRTGPLGFREPGWAPQKRAGLRRIALIGDSYVFGIGVEVGDTLSSALAAELTRRAPGQAVEVLNLGIPGTNLSSSVDVYAAAATLDVDAVVFCLTLPNDLSRWDVEMARREAGRIGAFSAARFFLGEGAGVLWDLFRLEQTTTPAGLAHLDLELRRLAALRESSSRPPQLVFFAFREVPSAIGARLGEVPGARVVPEGETFPEDFLPGDGHPTAQGNRRSARRIAEALQQGGE